MIYAENILICIAIPLLLAMFFVRGSALRFVIGTVSGMAACLLSAYISGFLGVVAGTGQQTSIYISPIVEELRKMIPLILYLGFFLPQDENIFIMAVGTGTGFATLENCCYLLTFGADSLPYVLVRGSAVGVMHCVCTIILVSGLIVARRFRVLTFPGIFGALSLSMIFHALYNLLVSARAPYIFIGYGLPIVTAVVLYYPIRLLRESDQK